jgi:hypothetical protein
VANVLPKDFQVLHKAFLPVESQEKSSPKGAIELPPGRLNDGGQTCCPPNAVLLLGDVVALFQPVDYWTKIAPEQVHIGSLVDFAQACFR